MPTDWDALLRDIDTAIDSAARETDRQLASSISSLTRLTDEEVIRLFPERADAKRVAHLMRIVHSARSENEKVNGLVNNIEDLAGVTVRLLGYLA